MRTFAPVSSSMLVSLLAACASTPAPTSTPVAAGKPAAAPVEPPAGPTVVEGNGRVVEVVMPKAKSVAFRLLFYTGSIDDPAGKEGLTKLTANLMVQGGVGKLTYPQLLRALYPLAADVSVQVDKEQTVFFGEVHVDRVEDFVPLITQVVLAPRFDKQAFSRIRDDMINDIEKRLRATDDENLSKELLNLMLYQGDHPYGHFDGGTVQGLKRITIEDVKAHAANMFGRRRLLIGMAGAVTPAHRQLVTKALSRLPDGVARVADVRFAASPSTNEVWIAEKPSAGAVAISIGYPHWARRGHSDWAALALIQSYLGEHRQFHGLLMSELREKRGLNYGDYAYVEAFKQEGWSRLPANNVARRRQHFEIWIRPVAPDDAIFAVRLALFYVDRVLRKGLTKEEVSGMRGFLKGYTNLFAMTPMRRLGYALDDDFYGTDKYLETFRAELDELDAGAVNAVLRRHLVAQPVRIAVVAPRSIDIFDGFTSGVRIEHRYPTDKSSEIKADDRAAADMSLPVSGDTIRVFPIDALFEK